MAIRLSVLSGTLLIDRDFEEAFSTLARPPSSADVALALTNAVLRPDSTDSLEVRDWPFKEAFSTIDSENTARTQLRKAGLLANDRKPGMESLTLTVTDIDIQQLHVLNRRLKRLTDSEGVAVAEAVFDDLRAAIELGDATGGLVPYGASLFRNTRARKSELIVGEIERAWEIQRKLFRSLIRLHLHHFDRPLETVEEVLLAARPLRKLGDGSVETTLPRHEADLWIDVVSYCYSSSLVRREELAHDILDLATREGLNRRDIDDASWDRLKEGSGPSDWFALSRPATVERGSAVFDKRTQPPLPVRTFVDDGRVAALDEALRNNPLAVIEGPIGSGKTVLAHHRFDRERTRGAVGIWVDGSDYRSAQLGFAELGRRAGGDRVGPESIDELAKLGARWLEENLDWVLVIDNVTQWKGRELDRLLPRSNRGLTILTTSDPSILRSHATHVPISDFRDCQELYDYVMNRSGVDRRRAETLLETVGRLPIALDLAVSFVQAHRIEDFLDLMDNSPSTAMAGPDRAGLTQQVSTALEGLAGSTRELAYLVAAFDLDRLPIPLVRPPVDAEDWAERCRAITALGLAAQDANQLMMHKAVRVLVIGLDPDPRATKGRVDAAVDRAVLDAELSTALSAAQLVDAATRIQSSNAMEPEAALAGMTNCVSGLMSGNRPREATRLVTLALGMLDRNTPVLTHERTNARRLMTRLGEAAIRLNQSTGAYETLRMAIQLIDISVGRDEHLELIAYLADAAFRAGHTNEASILLREHLGAVLTCNNPSVQTRALRVLGRLRTHTGDIEGAMECYSLGIRLGDPRDSTYTTLLNSVARLRSVYLADLEGAAETYREAINVAVDQGNRASEALYRRNLAEVLRRLGVANEACEQLEIAKNYDQVLDRTAALIRSSFAAIERLNGNWAVAHQLYVSSIDALRANAKDSNTAFSAGIHLIVSGVLSDSVTRSQVEDLLSQVESHIGEAVSEVNGASLEVSSIRRALGRSRPDDEPRRRLTSGFHEPWHDRYSRAFVVLLDAMDGHADGRDVERAFSLAVARCGYEGVLSDNRETISFLKALSHRWNTGAERVARRVLSRAPDIVATDLDLDRLAQLTDRYLNASADVNTNSYRVPTNLAEQRELTLAAGRSGRSYEPRFEYEPVPRDLDNPLTELARTIDPGLSIWDELLLQSIEDDLDTIEATRSRDGMHMLRVSDRVFGGIAEPAVQAAHDLLQGGPQAETGERVGAERAAELLSRVIDRLGLERWAVEVTPAISARMSISGPRSMVRVRDGSEFLRSELERLVLHEVGVHILRRENARRQRLRPLELSLGRNLMTEEGLAVFNERSNDVMDRSTERRYALRLVACSMLGESTFFEVFTQLAEFTDDQEEAFEITMRTKRGVLDGSDAGGFRRDHVYFQGALEIEELIKRSPDALDLLMAAKLPYTMIRTLRDLRDKGLLESAYYAPTDALDALDE